MIYTKYIPLYKTMITVHYSVVHYTLYTVVYTYRSKIQHNDKYQVQRQSNKPANIRIFFSFFKKKILCNLNYPRAEQKKLSFDGITMQEYQKILLTYYISRMFINIILLSIFYFYVCFWFPDWFRSRYHCIRLPNIHFFSIFI